MCSCPGSYPTVAQRGGQRPTVQCNSKPPAPTQSNSLAFANSHFYLLMLPCSQGSGDWAAAVIGGKWRLPRESASHMCSARSWRVHMEQVAGRARPSQARPGERCWSHLSPGLAFGPRHPQPVACTCSTSWSLWQGRRGRQDVEFVRWRKKGGRTQARIEPKTQRLLRGPFYHLTLGGKPCTRGSRSPGSTFAIDPRNCPSQVSNLRVAHFLPCMHALAHVHMALPANLFARKRYRKSNVSDEDRTLNCTCTRYLPQNA